MKNPGPRCVGACEVDGRKGFPGIERSAGGWEPVCKRSPVRELDCKCCEPVSAVRELLGLLVVLNILHWNQRVLAWGFRTCQYRKVLTPNQAGILSTLLQSALLNFVVDLFVLIIVFDISLVVGGVIWAVSSFFFLEVIGDPSHVRRDQYLWELVQSSCEIAARWFGVSCPKCPKFIEGKDILEWSRAIHVMLYL